MAQKFVEVIARETVNPLMGTGNYTAHNMKLVLAVDGWAVTSGGASYGAKGLKPPQILLKPPPQIFV